MHVKDTSKFARTVQQLCPRGSFRAHAAVREKAENYEQFFYMQQNSVL